MLVRAARNLRACFVAILATLAFVGTVGAAPSDTGLASRQFGNGRPVSLNDLPPGQLKRRLESLAPKAQSNALRWLQYISFTGTDLDLLRVDDGGGVFFADTMRPDNAMRKSASKSTGTVSAAYVPSDAFFLHSRPGATKRVYLDFNGHTFTNTAWGAGTFVGVAFSSDADRANFSDAERTAIISIWHRVAEDLAPFDIDVTTEEPASFNATTGRVLITEDNQADGSPMPSQGAGGVAYVNVFGASNYHTYYSPALVYAENLGPNVDTYIAEASSHEFGHNLGLSHDGTNAGVAYYAGHGTGLVSWAPIMGNSYYNNVTEWSKGEYTDANQTQDDLAIIGAKLGFRPDDHGNTIASGTALTVAGNGTVDSSNPELDPYNLLPQNKGVINSGTDVDVFTFVSGSGPLTLTVTPAWDAFYRATSRRAANLDVGLELRDNAGNLVASSDPNTDTSAVVSATVAAGTYHLLVTGVGNAVTPYSDYASLGQFFINGSITTGVADTTAPNPNPMTWASVPSPTGANTIAMTASTAVDDISTVQYRFNCTSGGTGCVVSAWQAGTSYVATGLAPSTQYTFTVQARDFSGNTTAASSAASATTDTPPPPPPFVDYVASSETLVVGVVSGTFASTASDDGVAESITEIESGGKPAKRYSYLEHRWSFNISAGLVSTTVYANAWSNATSTDGDTFNFQYSTNGGSTWSTVLFSVSSTSNGNVQSASLPAGTSGTVIVRVVDSNRVAGKRTLDKIFIDRLYIRAANQ